MVTFYAFPKEHWCHLRTTNLWSRPLPQSGSGPTRPAATRGGSATALIWKRSRWPRSRGGIAVPQLLPLVGSGMIFMDGVGLKSGTKGDVSDQPERNAT